MVGTSSNQNDIIVTRSEQFLKDVIDYTQSSIIFNSNLLIGIHQTISNVNNKNNKICNLNFILNTILNCLKLFIKYFLSFN